MPWSVTVRERWLPWQQLQLVLCCVNNFYDKLSSNIMLQEQFDQIALIAYWSMFVKVIGHNMRARFWGDTV